MDWGTMTGHGVIGALIVLAIRNQHRLAEAMRKQGWHVDLHIWKNGKDQQ